MKKTLIVLMMVLLAAVLIVSCANEPSKYTVTFDLNGGDGDVPDSQTVVEGDKATKPTTDPTPANTVYYKFAYWAKEGETTEFDFSKGITADTKLVAKWKDKYEIGDTGPAGGTIFYINGNYDASSTEEAKNWKYLEAAPEDLTYTDGEGNVSNTFIFGLNWSMATGTAQKQLCGTSGNSDGNGDNAKIGKGKANTATLVQKLGSYAGNSESNYMSNTSVYAAKLCDDYGKDTEYDDWFLPSLNELKEL